MAKTVRVDHLVEYRRLVLTEYSLRNEFVLVRRGPGCCHFEKVGDPEIVLIDGVPCGKLRKVNGHLMQAKREQLALVREQLLTCEPLSKCG